VAQKYLRNRIVDRRYAGFFSSIACHIRVGAKVSDSRYCAKTSNDFWYSRLIGGVAREMPIQGN
jgi:hypothetical protein